MLVWTPPSFWRTRARSPGRYRVLGKIPAPKTVGDALWSPMFVEWRPIPGWEARYEASSLGQIRNAQTGQVLRPWGRGEPHRRQNYLRVELWRDGIPTKARVHQLVASAFLGPRPVDLETMHINENGVDNRASNLKYGTRSENLLAAHRHLRATTQHTIEGVSCFSPSSTRPVLHTA
jgi:hypothetical protein